MAEYSSNVESDKLAQASLTTDISQFVQSGRENRQTKSKFRIIQEDANTSIRDRDAPGQNCVYIPPGDHRAEFYRLGTYAKFPKEVPAKPTDMAAAGFYWTGYKDRVKCFSCGMTAENWSIGDDGLDYQLHKSTCNMTAGQERLNIPIPEPNFRSLFRLFRVDPNTDIGFKVKMRLPMDISDEMGNIRLSEPLRINFANIIDPEHEAMLKRVNLRSELERRKTFAKWPSYPAPFLVSDLAKEGFFYLGNLDRAQCFSCSGVLRNWAPNDSVFEQHRRHFSHCKICRGEESGNISMPANERVELDRQKREEIQRLTTNHGEPPDPAPEDQRQLAERFPCREPVNPHMISLASRIATFDSRWPRHRIRAPVEQIAKAGFFFLGESDKTKCYYCNGGLQNWDANDEPWTEHAKWFPGCEFILRKKGVEFVKRMKDAHPNLNRPYIRNPVSLDVPPSEVRRTSRNSPMEVTAPAGQGINITELMNMGFTKEQIDRAIARRRGTRYTMDELVLDLVEQSTAEQPVPASSPPTDIQQRPSASSARNKREGDPESNVTVKKTRTSPPASLTTGSEMAESLREMEEAVLCRQCKKNKSEMTMIPCGHLCLCEGCSTNVKRCIICKARVVEKIKVYRA